MDDDEKEGLLIPTIATRRELVEFEQPNIEKIFKLPPFSWGTEYLANKGLLFVQRIDH